MKHFLKPIGHCLTTAIMTSTMLKVYALPAEAASVDPAAIDAENGDSISQESMEEPIQPVADVSPETIASPASAFSGSEQVGGGAEPVEQAAPVSAEPEPISQQPKMAAPAPIAPNPSEVPASSSAVTDQAAPNEANSSSQPGHVEAHENAQPTSAQSNDAQPANVGGASPEAAQTETGTASGEANNITAIRQTLAKKLATIVERDRSSREAQLQKNLIDYALHYAETGDFDRARQIAQHPALPIATQTDLLAKIDAVEAQLTGRSGPVPTLQLGQAQAGPGRTVRPPNITPVYPTASTWGTPATPDLGSVYWGDRCLAPQADSGSLAHPSSTNTVPTLPKAASQPLIATIEPHLASRLVQLVKSNKLQVKLAAIPSQPDLAYLQSAGIQASAKIGYSSPELLSSSEQAIAAPVQPVSQSVQEIDQPFTLDRMVGSLLVKPLSQVGIALPETIPTSIEAAFGWWTFSPEISSLADGVGSTSVDRIDSAQAERTPLSTTSPTSSIAAEEGLINSQWMNSMERLPDLLHSKDAIKETTLKQTSQQKSQIQNAATRLNSNSGQLMAFNCSGGQAANFAAGSYTINPATSKQMGWVNLMFPLPIPAAITSIFGWRVHPISGDMRFHSGIDLGVAWGTPVLAALPGRVVAAEDMGGYGLAVVIEDTAAKQRNLYGHLSGIAVQPGTVVKQGSVLGWVGSTGNSTGPHLHFETQVPMTSGWTAIDPLAEVAVSTANGHRPAAQNYAAKP
jgi:murein DD-endopeptidase MepM/ murein hydrolase activator NlpD